LGPQDCLRKYSAPPWVQIGTIKLCSYRKSDGEVHLKGRLGRKEGNRVNIWAAQNVREFEKVGGREGRRAVGKIIIYWQGKVKRKTTPGKRQAFVIVMRGSTAEAAGDEGEVEKSAGALLLRRAVGNISRNTGEHSSDHARNEKT